MTGEMVISTIFMIISAGGFMNALSFPGGTSDGVPGAGFFPEILCVIIFILNFIVLVKAIVKYRSEQKEKVKITETHKSGLIKIGLILICTIVLIMLWGKIHFLALSAIYLVLVGIILQLELKKYIPGAIAASIIVYFVFQNLLNVMLNN